MTRLDDRVAPVESAVNQTAALVDLEPDDWHADLDSLATGLVARHRDAFHEVSPAQFDAAVARLHERIPRLSGTETLVGFEVITALIGDGHTYIETDHHYRRFPLELFWYDDQLRVVKPVTDMPRVLGSQLVAVNGVPVEQIDRELQAVIAQGENPWYERAHGADRLSCADVLAALGPLSDLDTGRFTFVDQQDTTFATDIRSLPPGTAPSWPSPQPDAPLRWRRPGDPLASTRLADGSTIYANFRRYDRLQDRAARLITQLLETKAARLILDLRDNTGGDYTLARQHLIYPIWGLPAINRPGGLYVLIGRKTYSAAMVTATDFRQETEAVLVGEPTGARPVGYQESGTFALPRSGLRVHCAIRRYRFGEEGIPAVFPDQRIDPDWGQETRGHDPAIDWCLQQPA